MTDHFSASELSADSMPDVPDSLSADSLSADSLPDVPDSMPDADGVSKLKRKEKQESDGDDGESDDGSAHSAPERENGGRSGGGTSNGSSEAGGWGGGGSHEEPEDHSGGWGHAGSTPSHGAAQETESRDILQALRDAEPGYGQSPEHRYSSDIPVPTWVLGTDVTQVIAPIPSATREHASPAPPIEHDTLTCPECGTVGTIVVSRRDAADFCQNCDFPLFWTPSRVILDRANLNDDSLRRLPGTVGMVTVASAPCPHCSEPNAVTAVNCIRCGRPLTIVRERAPEPVYVPPPPPPPVYEPEPEPVTPWWVWLLFYLSLSGAVVLVILYATKTIG